MRSLGKGRLEPSGSELVEIITPRTNAAIITPSENLFASISLPEPFSLEIVGTHSGRWFVARARSDAMRRHLEAQLAVAYPQTELRRLDITRYPGLDPARVRPDERVAACTLGLRAPAYLPLRTFRDTEVDATHHAQADPILGVLGALGDLPEGWRGLAQLVLRPAADDWCRDYLRLTVEHPLAAERVSQQADTSLTQVFALAGLLVVGTLALQSYHWYRAGDWGHLAALIGSLLLGVPALIWLLRHRTKRPIYDMRLVQDKVSRIAYRTQLRLAIIAPGDVPGNEVEVRLQRLAAAYRQFNLASGNGFRPRRLDLRGHDLRALNPLPSVRAAVTVNTRELAGLWHLPQAPADVPLLERTSARRLLPLPHSVARGCRIGVSARQGRTVPVSLPEDVLRRHLLLVAKTRRGKSSVLLRLAQHAMAAHQPGALPAGLVLIDPHRDLAQAALGLVPVERQENVVYLDVAERERPFGLNLLDVGLGWDRDKAVSNCLAVFRHEFEGYWGPRMEDAFRYALLTLYEANAAICAKGPAGRDEQYTVLQVPALLTLAAFRNGLLELVTDPVIKAWWEQYFDPLDHRLATEIVNPVQTKVQKYAGSYAARSIVGQSRSTVDPLGWIRSGAIVIVNTAKGVVGEDTAALLGATLLNLVALGIAEQAALEARHRRSVMLVVDEFHSLPGADYDAILSELAKYGANLVLATQSLATLEAFGREQNRALRAKVFSNLDGLFAFHTSAEDARYLVPELGGEVDEQDLVALGEYQCYAKLSTAGARLPTFWVQLDPPPSGDPALHQRLVLASATRFGRDRVAVERDLQTTLDRIAASGTHWPKDVQPAEQPPDTKGKTDMGPEPGPSKRKRNEHRNQPAAGMRQNRLFDGATGRAVAEETQISTVLERPDRTGEAPAS